MKDYLVGVIVVGSVIGIMWALFVMGFGLGKISTRNEMFDICKTGSSLVRKVDYAKLVLTCEVVK